MKIAIICDVLGEANNGTTIAATNLINHMRKSGHDVTVVCPDQFRKGEDGYCVVPTLKVTPIVGKILKANGVSLAKADEKILTDVIKDVDVVQIELPFFLGIKAMKIAKELGKPITASFHAQAENITAHVGLMNCQSASKRIYRWMWKHFYRFVDEIHYPTQFIKDTFESAIGQSTPAHVISNGVNPEFFEKKDVTYPRISDKFTILCAGRFSTEKAQQQLIKAIGKSKHKEDIKVVFAGSGPKENKLRRLAKKHGVDADFRFFGREELIATQHAADLYVHTAIIEIEALCCIESIVSGLVPLICNSPRSATAAFAIDDKSLFKQNDVAELAEKIDFWYENPDVLQQYKQLYRQRIAAFDQERCMRQMEQMITSAAHK